MRFLHVADLHLGKRVYERLMIDQQRHVFQQIIQSIKQNDIDAVLVAGDIFDRPYPIKEALELSDELFSAFIQCGVPVFAIPGNHDSAQLVSYCSSVTAAAGLHIAKAYNGKISTFNLNDSHGTVTIHMLPFLRPTDVRMAYPEEADSIKSHHDAVAVALAHHEINPTVRNVLIAHQFVVSGSTIPETCESETVSVGGIDSVDASLFDAFDYVALGHMHGAQSIGRPQVRYAGSPYPYSFSEAKHEKSMTIVDLAERSVDIKTIPLVPDIPFREIEGSFDDLIAGKDTGDHQDFMHIRLTDTSIYDALNRLRVHYPNLLLLDWKDTFKESQSAALSLTQMKQKTPLELFNDFFTMQTGEALSEKQKELFLEIISKEGE